MHTYTSAISRYRGCVAIAVALAGTDITCRIGVAGRTACCGQAIQYYQASPTPPTCTGSEIAPK